MPQGSGFLGQWKGNLAQRVGRQLVQGFLPGNQSAGDGTLNNSAVWKGAAGAGARVVGGMFLGPAGATIAGKVSGRLIDGKSVLPSFLTDGNRPLQQPDRVPMGQHYGLDVPDAGMSIGMGPLSPSLGFPSGAMGGASNYQLSPSFGQAAMDRSAQMAQTKMAGREAMAMAAIQARINAAGSGMGSQMGGARGQSGGGITGDAARGMFQGMTDATRFAPIVGYGQHRPIGA